MPVYQAQLNRTDLRSLAPAAGVYAAHRLGRGHDLVREPGRRLPAPRLALEREPGRLLPVLRLELERWTGTAR